MLKVLQKYDIKRIPDSIILFLTREAEHHPGTVYALACGYQLTEVANIAARASLKRPLLQETIPREDLILISGYDYDRFISYHRLCSGIASQTATSFDWMTHPSDLSMPAQNMSCRCPFTGIYSPSGGPAPGNNWDQSVLDWVLDFMKDCAEELKTTPNWDVMMRKGTVMMSASVAAVSSQCPYCQNEVEKLPIFAEHIGRQVDAEIASVRLPSFYASCTLIYRA